MMTAAEFLHANYERLLAEWRHGAESSVSSRGLSKPDLESLIPRFLYELARVDSAASTHEQQRLIESHLSRRLRQGFELAEVVFEFSLLSRVIGAALEEQPAAERPSAAEVARLFSKLSDAIVAATKIFNEQLLEDEQREKRYARLISDIVNQAVLGNGATPLTARLREVLQLIMEAMSAQSASLLLVDPHDPNKLIAMASTGRGDEALAKYVTSVDSDSFAGRVAASEREPIEARGVASGFVPVSETLQTSGIRRLLGIRLPAHHRLRGVLYVGLIEDREFTPSELRRLASLGERLTVHLDNAQLVSELRSSVAAIHVFVDALAHDLRGPLTVVKLAASRIGQDPTSIPLQMPRLVRSLDRVEQMVTDLLDAHRMEAGQLTPLTLSTFDLAALLRDLAEEINQQSGNRVVALIPGEIRGRWSSAYIRRAVWNLVMNGLKYGAPGAPVAIQVRVDSEHVEIAVHNDGPPIPAEQLRLLFQVFARGAPPRAAAKSWGLGLFLVRAVAEAHGGSVEVASNEHGTTFAVKIPRNAPAFEHGTTEHAPSP